MRIAKTKRTLTPKTGYVGQKTRNETTNYGPDSHQEFCRRCRDKNGGSCPADNPTHCNL